MSSSRQRIRDHHGRDTRLARVPAALGGVVGGDTPVFDSARSVTPLRDTHAPESRSSPYGFKADRPTGTPVPFHEPDPDRFAKSDALRARLEAEEQRKKDARSTGTADSWAPGYLRPAPPPGLPSGRPNALVIPRPRGTYTIPPEGKQNIMAVRDGTVLLFATSTEAERCLTGKKNPYGSLVRAALARPAGERIAFGWEWTRFAPSGRGETTK